MQEPTLSLDAARSPLMYNLSYSLEAIVYGHPPDEVVQDWCTSFSVNVNGAKSREAHSMSCVSILF